MVGWFEIPVNDMSRAKAFYEAVFKVEVTEVDFNGLKMGWFPDNNGAYGATGTLIQQDSYVPSRYSYRKNVHPNPFGVVDCIIESLLNLG